MRIVPSPPAKGKSKEQGGDGLGRGHGEGRARECDELRPSLSLEMTTHESVESSVDAAGAFFLKVSQLTLLRFAITSVYYRSFSTSSLN